MFAMKPFRYLLVALALFAMAGVARANPSGGSSLVTASVTFNNLNNYQINALDMFAVWDPDMLSFNSLYDPSGVFAQFSDPTASVGDPGASAHTYFQDPGVITLNGTITLGLTFNALAPLGTGTTPVDFDFYFSSSVGDTFVDYRGPYTVTVQGLGGSPSPIPEPETWAMLLGGLGLVALVTRRRRHLASKRV